MRLRVLKVVRQVCSLIAGVLQPARRTQTRRAGQDSSRPDFRALHRFLRHIANLHPSPQGADLEPTMTPSMLLDSPKLRSRNQTGEIKHSSTEIIRITPIQNRSHLRNLRGNSLNPSNFPGLYARRHELETEEYRLSDQWFRDRCLLNDRNYRLPGLADATDQLRQARLALEALTSGPQTIQAEINQQQQEIDEELKDAIEDLGTSLTILQSGLDAMGRAVPSNQPGSGSR